VYLLFYSHAQQKKRAKGDKLHGYVDQIQFSRLPNANISVRYQNTPTMTTVLEVKAATLKHVCFFTFVEEISYFRDQYIFLSFVWTIKVVFEIVTNGRLTVQTSRVQLSITRQ